MDNAGSDANLDSLREGLRDRLRFELHPAFIHQDPILLGFRKLHVRIGRSNHRFPSSAESLVSLFLRKGILPVINNIVDIYNSVSLETRLSIGAHDLALVRGDIELRLTTGTETFTPLGSVIGESIPAGEYAYIDDDNRVLCRLEHRQCDQTKITRETSACFFILQGHAATSRALLEEGLTRLEHLTRLYCGGRVTNRWISD